MGKGLPEGGQGKSRLLGHKDWPDRVSHRVMEAESKMCLEHGRIMTELVTWRGCEVSLPSGAQFGTQGAAVYAGPLGGAVQDAGRPGEGCGDLGIISPRS